MGRGSFDWRWVVVIFIALVLFGQLSLRPSPSLGVLLLALGGYWAISAGLEPWRGRGSLMGSRRVTYWRGQRIELGPARRARTRVNLPPTTGLIVSILYLTMGVGLIFAALRLLLRLVGV